METKLLPCPFCPDGGEPKISRYSYELEYGAHVYCRRCNTSGPEIHESMPLEDVEVLAIEAWNTRHERTCEMELCDTGEWFTPECREKYLFCSNCKFVGYYVQAGEDGDYWCEKPKYCPECGARVKEANDA